MQLKPHLSIVLLLLIFSSTVLAQEKVKGQIIDSETKKPVPFVAIVPENYAQYGTVSDMDGFYTLTIPNKAKKIRVAHVSYKVKVITKQEILINAEIRINPTLFEIKEVLVNAKENPAYRIIRNAAKNKKQHNPEKYDYYKCDIYQKTFMGPMLDDTVTIDTVTQKIKNIADSLYLFIMETHSKKYHEYAKGSKEIVEAIQVTGFEKPEFFMGNNEIQPFHFYDEYINLYESLFLSPISKAAIGKYYYEITDTIISKQDTIFTIFYRPYRNKVFDGLTGQLQINTNGYAIQNIFAKPAGPHLIKINVHQQYYFINGKWFPEEINYDMVVENAQLPGFKMKMSGRSKMRNTIFVKQTDANIPIDHIAYEFIPEAYNRDSTYWFNYRKDSLTFKERHSYKFMDSIFKKAKIEKRMRWVFKFAESGKVPLKYVSIDPFQTIGYNNHEGLRVGLGLYTNDDIAKWFTLGGYYREGLVDEIGKYGADITFKPDKQNRFWFGGGFANDLEEPGYNNFDQVLPSVFSRSLLLQRADSAFTYFGFVQRQFGKWFVRLDGKSQTLVPKYEYKYVPNSNIVGFTNNQIRLSLRYAPKERVSMIFGYPFSIENEPVFRLQYIYGFKDNLGRGYNYHKVLFSARHYYKIAGLGQSNIHLKAGYVSNNVPLFALIEGEGSYDANLAFIFDGYFQNIAPSQFFNNIFTGLFYKHNFGPVIRLTPVVKPELVIAHNMGWGELYQKQNHKHFEFSSMEKGYFESGVIIQNVLMQSFFNIFYLGIGGGAFYKYGAYASNKPANNFVYKISVQLKY